MQRLPYLKRNHRSGNWVYFRRLPVAVHRLTGRQFFERSLGTADHKRLAEAWAAANRAFDNLVGAAFNASASISSKSDEAIPLHWFEEKFKFGRGPWDDTHSVLLTPPDKILRAVKSWGEREKYRRAQNILNDPQYRENVEVFEQECKTAGACGYTRNWFMFCPPLIKLTHDLVNEYNLGIPVGHQSLTVVHNILLQELVKVLEAENRWRQNDFRDLPTAAPALTDNIAPNNKEFLRISELVNQFNATTRKPKKPLRNLRSLRNISSTLLEVT